MRIHNNMKTSNKLLIAGTVMMVVLVFAGNIYTKANMNVTRQDAGAKGNGVMVTRTILENLHSDMLILDSNFKYVLNPESNAVTVTMDENLANNIKATDNGKLVIFREGNVSYTTANLEIQLGVKDKTDLKIEMDDFAKLYTSSLLSCNLVIVAEDNTKISLDLASLSVSLDIEDRTNVVLGGSTKNLIVDIEDTARLQADNIEIDSLKVIASDNGQLRMGNVQNVDLSLEDRSWITFPSMWKTGSYIYSGYAKIVVGEKDIKTLGAPLDSQ